MIIAGTKRAAQLREEGFAVAGEALLGRVIKRAGLLPFFLEHGQVPHRDRQVDRRDRHLQFHCALRGPHAGAFLPGHVEDFVDQPLAGLLVLLGENMAGDLDQIAVEFALVP